MCKAKPRDANGPRREEVFTMAVLHSPPSSGRRRCQAVVMGIGVAMEVEVAVAAVYMLMVPASRQQAAAC